MAKKIVVYTTEYCPYCVRAKALLKQREIPFEEKRIADDDDATWEMLRKKSGMMTVPQIFADDRVIGGYTDLAALDARDGLASLK